MTTTNYSKMSTAILKKKLSSASAEEKKAINAVLAKRDGQVPTGDLKGKVVEFTSRSGLKVKGEVVSVIVGKKDEKTYYGVRQDDKLYYKQKDKVKLVK